MLLRWLWPVSSGALKNRAAELSIAVAAKVRDRTWNAARDMERAEARGYVRAHVGPILAMHLKAMSQGTPQPSASALDWLRQDVTERVVRQVLDDVVRAKVLAARRAA